MRIGINAIYASSQRGIIGVGRFVLGLVHSPSELDLGSEIVFLSYENTVYLFPSYPFLHENTGLFSDYLRSRVWPTTRALGTKRCLIACEPEYGHGSTQLPCGQARDGQHVCSTCAEDLVGGQPALARCPDKRLIRIGALGRLRRRLLQRGFAQLAVAKWESVGLEVGGEQLRLMPPPLEPVLALTVVCRARAPAMSCIHSRGRKP